MSEDMIEVLLWSLVANVGTVGSRKFKSCNDVVYGGGSGVTKVSKRIQTCNGSGADLVVQMMQVV